MEDEHERFVGSAIITYSRSYQALAAIRSLGRRGIRVIAGDEYSVTPGSMSRYTRAHFQYPNPAVHPDGFLDVIDRVINEHAPPGGEPFVLMPVHRESPLIARERRRFEGRVRVPLAPYDSFRTVQHKARLTRYAQALGVPTPHTLFPRSRDELAQRMGELTFPSFVKVPVADSGVGVVKVESEQELLDVFEELVDRYQLRGEDLPLVQEAAPGHDYCVTGLFDRGEPKAVMTYRNVTTWPRNHGAGVVRETVEAKEAERLAERLLASLVWHGVAQVDFRWSGHREDAPRLLEVNPRFFGGMFQAVASGVDYPWLLFSLAAGLPVERPKPDLDVRTEAPVVGLLATIRDVAADEQSLRRLSDAWDEAVSQARLGHGFRAVRSILGAVKRTVDVDARLEHARQVLRDNEDNLSVLFDQKDDPLPMLGLIYPLSVFLRHGKVSHELMSSIDRPTADG